MLFRFGNFKSPVRYFCKSSEEAVVHLSSSCSLSKNICSQAQIFFELSHYPYYLATWCHSWFYRRNSRSHNVVINQILLIFKHYFSRN